MVQEPLTLRALRIKRSIIGIGAMLYIVFLVWSLILLSVLPNEQGALQELKLIGVLSCIAAGIVFLLAGIFGFARINHPSVPVEMRPGAALRTVLAILPGLAIAGAVPFIISREPALILDIVQPKDPADFVAPLSVTFSVKEASEILQRMGKNPIQYKWDIDGDGKVNEETVQPELTVNYDKEGVFTTQVRIVMSDRSTRLTGRRMIIRKSVFAISPAQPVVERPAVFNIDNLVPDKQQIKQIVWDFEGDGKQLVKTKETEIKHTFYTTGPRKISVAIELSSKTKSVFERKIEVVKPAPLPFPISVETEPKHLIGNVKFGARFIVKTEEPLSDIEWDFGDDSEPQHGRSVVHTFDRKGDFAVITRARSEKGEFAELSTIVHVVDELRLNDLTFFGAPEIGIDGRITGEAPVTVELTPKTTTPFVNFTWEAPDASEVGSLEKKLQAIYREPGEYTIILIGQDAENHVMVKKILLEVKRPTSSLSLTFNPEGGLAPLNVTFDGSLSFVPDDTISGFVWSFGDRTDEVFGGAVVEHTYDEPGTYTINMTVKTVSKKEFRASKQIVIRAPLLDACIVPSRMSGKAPLGVRFDASCTEGNVTAHAWDFGDGSTSTLASPDHVFEKSGTYAVKLTVTGKEKDQQSVQKVTISVSEK